ncbi:pantoate--beta-alanine ligase, partial [Paracoccus thiocyanatus]
MSAPIVRPLAELRAMVGGWKARGESIGVVPTMGALHEGHLSLVRAARASCDRVIVTLFVNPRQFNSPEDFARYPRTEHADAELLAPLGVDALFVPDGDEVYPPGHATVVTVSGVTEPLEGAHRPGHFDGVATVVTMLFTMTQADRAFFGEKDWQQLQLVRRLAADLKLPVQIVACPCVRAADGLALSSRNQRLTDAGRERAAALPRALFDAAARIEAGEPVAAVLAAARAGLGGG